MIEDTKTYVNFLIELDITPNQFLILWIVTHKEFEALYRYSTKGAGFKLEEVLALEEKGLIINVNKEDEYFMDSIIPTDEFLQKLVNFDPLIPAEEFWETYPATIFVNNKRVSGRTADKDKLLLDYSKKYGKSVQKHKRIMDALRWAIRNNHISMGIEKWFRSEQWEIVLDMKKHQEDAGLRELPGERIH